MTKSFFMTMIVAILIGAFLGNFLFRKYKLESDTVLKEVNNIYFLEKGAYDSMEQALKDVPSNRPYLIVKEDISYYIYLSITSSRNNLERIKKIYKNNEINVRIKKTSLKNESFLALLEQMDILLSKANNIDDIDPINEVILDNYKSIVLE